MESTLSDPSLRIGSWNEEGGAWPSSIDELRVSNAAMHEGDSFGFDPEEPVDGWLGVWHFNEDLRNEISGRVAFGESIRFTNACP